MINCGKNEMHKALLAKNNACLRLTSVKILWPGLSRQMPPCISGKKAHSQRKIIIRWP
jgi:hypothetical protein